MGNRPHQLPARRATGDADATCAGIAVLNKALRHIHEIVEGVCALVQLPIQIPLLAQIIAAPDMCHGIGESAIQQGRSEEHTSELQSLMRISYAVFCLKNKT